MMKKYLLWIFAAAAAVMLLIGISGIIAAYIFPGKAEFPAAVEIRTGMPVQPGESVEYSLPVTLPANMRIADVEISGENIMPLPQKISGGKYLWNRRVWKVSGRFRVLKEGKILPLHLKFAVRQIFSSRIREVVEVPLPEISAALDPKLVPGSELLVAGEISRAVPGKSWRSWHWLWLILPVAALAVFMLRRNIFRRMLITTPWDKALYEIDRLRHKVKKGRLTPEKGFAALCDVVRDYLEVRFDLPAPRCTTQEFMKSFQHGNLIFIPEEQLSFLHRFLDTADMIKFARAAADDQAFAAAADRAGELIRATSEKEKEK